MKFIKTIAILVVFFPATAFPEILSNVTIEEMRVRALGTNSVVKFSSNFVRQCEDTAAYGLLRTDGTEGAKLAWSMLLTAFSADTPVTICTNDTCSHHNVITEVTLSK